MSDEAASKNPLPAPGAMSPPVIPERQSSKRRAVESIESLEAQRKKLSKRIQQSKQGLSRMGSYDTEYTTFPRLKD